MTLTTFTFIRHGESTDNLRMVWAGWQDAVLSNHGMNQARALGDSFHSTKLTAIYSSPLKRALMTAQALQDGQQSPKPALTTSPLLREQHFGVAEGKPWTTETIPNCSLEEHIARGIYPVPNGRAAKFPEGESLNDLQQRAGEAIRELILPHVWRAAKEGTNDVHVALVSHGLCISEAVAALVRMDSRASTKSPQSFKGLMNTAWTRVAVEIADPKGGLEFDDSHPPSLTVRVMAINQHEHIDKIVRQKGIGSMAFDVKQTDIRAFFGGGVVVEAQEHSSSNALDETLVEEQ